MEGNNQVCNGGTNSGGGLIGKILVGAVGVAAGVIGAVIYKKKKNQNKTYQKQMNTKRTRKKKQKLTIPHFACFQVKKKKKYVWTIAEKSFLLKDT